MDIEEKYMHRALQIARLGEGQVSPNPMVGAVIVHNGRIIGEGFHRRYGDPHAEVNAIRSVAPADEPLLPESTIYVTLEPCSHYGKTPPCSKLLIEKGIRRIAIGCLDPFREVRGNGVRMLKAAGCEVATGVLENECQSLNSHFMTAHSRQRPFILLKWAESADRFIAGEHRQPISFSTPLTRLFVHKLRSEFDAIMVGSQTVITDNPSLTTRLWPGRNPLRVVLDRCRKIPPECQLLTDGNPTLRYDSGMLQPDSPLLPQICNDLYAQKGITSLIVEGGTRLLQAFIDSGLWDEIRIERSKNPLGNGIKAPRIPEIGASEKAMDGNTIITLKRLKKA